MAWESGWITDWATEYVTVYPTGEGTFALAELFLMDYFVTPEASPLVSPRDCEPGPGQLNIFQDDAGGDKFDIELDEKIYWSKTNYGWNQLAFLSTATFQNQKGLIFQTDIQPSQASDFIACGYTSSSSPGAFGMGHYGRGQNYYILHGAGSFRIGYWTDAGQEYTCKILTRATGAFVVVSGGEFSDNTLMFDSTYDMGATIRSQSVFISGAGYLDNYIVAKTDYEPAPLVNDSFLDTDGTDLADHLSDGLAVPEVGGGDLVWTVISGEINIQTNRATIVTDGQAYVNGIITDIFSHCTINRAGGTAGIFCRYLDATSPYWALRFINDTTIAIFEWDGAAWNNRAQVTGTYTPGTDYEVRLISDRDEISAFIGSTFFRYQTATTGKTHTLCGIIGDTVATNFDNYFVWRRHLTDFPYVPIGPDPIPVWVLNDEFTTDGAISDQEVRTCEPGPGELVFTITSGAFNIVDSALVATPGSAAWGELGFVSNEPQIRTSGRTHHCNFISGAVDATDAAYAIALAISPTFGYGNFNNVDAFIYLDGDGDLHAGSSSTDKPKVGDWSQGFDYGFAVIERVSGNFALAGGGQEYEGWNLLYPCKSGVFTSLYHAVDTYSFGGTWDNVQTSGRLWTPTPIVSDSFFGANGTNLSQWQTDGDGAPEGQKSPVTWVVETGSAQLNNFKAYCNVADTRISIEASQAKVLVQSVVNTPSGAAGIMLRLDSVAESHYQVEVDIDGDQFNLYDATDYSNRSLLGFAALPLDPDTNYDLLGKADGTRISGILDGTVVLEYKSASKNQDKTVHGMYGTALGATFDDFVIWERVPSDLPDWFPTPPPRIVWTPLIPTPSGFTPNLWAEARAEDLTSGGAREFDGVDQYFEGANNPTHQTGDVDWFQCGFVRFLTAPEPSSNEVVLLSQYDFGNNQRGYVLTWNTFQNRFIFYVSNDGTNVEEVRANNLGSPVINRWYFICVWHDSVNDKIHIAINDLSPNEAAHSTGVHLSTAKSVISCYENNGVVDTSYVPHAAQNKIAFGKTSVPIAGIIDTIRTRMRNNGIGLSWVEITEQERIDWGLTPGNGSFYSMSEASGDLIDQVDGLNLTEVNGPILPTTGPLVYETYDNSGNGNHGVLINFTDVENAYKTDIPDGTWGTIVPDESVNDNDGTLTNFDDIDAAATTDTPEGTFSTGIEDESSNSNHGLATNFADIDAAATTDTPDGTVSKVIIDESVNNNNGTATNFTDLTASTVADTPDDGELNTLVLDESGQGNDGTPTNFADYPASVVNDGPTSFFYSEAIPDESVNTNNGTATNFDDFQSSVQNDVPANKPNVGNSSILFDGVDDWVSIPDINESGTTLSVSCWVKNTSGTNTIIFSHYDSTLIQRSWLIGRDLTGNGFRVVLSGNGTFDPGQRKVYTANVVINDGSWHLIGFTWNAGELKLYHNGVEVVPTKDNDDAITSIHNSSSLVALACQTDNNNPITNYSGNIADPRIYNRVLTAQDFEDLHNGIDPTTTDLHGRWIGKQFGLPSSPNVSEYSLVCNGTDEWIDLPNNLGLIAPGSTPGSLSFWIKSTNDTPQTLFSFSDGTANDNWSAVYIGDATGTVTNSIIMIGTNTGGSTNNRIAYATANRNELFDGNWHHIAIVCEPGGQNYRIYLDGVSKTISVGAGNNNGNFFNNAALDRSSIATFKSDTVINWFDGTLSNVRVYNYGLSAAEVGELASGRDTETASRGSWIGKVFGPRWVKNIGEYSLVFPGVDEHIKLDTGPSSAGSQELTFSGWVKADQTGVGRYLWNNAGPGARIIAWGALVSGQLAVYDGTWRTFGVAPADGEWHHVCMTLSTASSEAKCYIDGIQFGTTQAWTSAEFTNQLAYIGCDSTGTNRFMQGNLLGFRWYNRILSWAEVGDLYNGTNPPDAEPNLVGRWLGEKFGPRNLPNIGTHSLESDGVDDWVTLGGVDSSGIKELTYAVWVKSTQTGTSKYLFDQSNTLLRFSWCGPSTNTLAAYDGTNREFGTAPNDGEWHHIAFSVSASSGQSRCYIDGVRFGGTLGWSNTALLDPSGLQAILSSNNGAVSNFQAKTLDHRFYNSVLSSAEILDLATGTDPATPPIGRWLGPKFVPRSLANIGEYSLDFDGVDDFVSIPDPDDGGASLSAVCWVKTTDFNSKYLFCHYETNNERAWALVLANSSWGAATGNELGVIIKEIGATGGNEKIYYTNQYINDGKWHHIAFTWGSATLLVYIDGVEASVVKHIDSAFTNINNSSGNASIGSALSSGAWVAGSSTIVIDSRIYNYTLDSSEVFALATGTNPVTPSVGHWLGPNWTPRSIPNLAGGLSLEYDRVDDYVEVPYNSIFDFDRTDPFSLTVWLKTSASSGTDMILTKTEADPTIKGYQVFLRNARDVTFVLSSNHGSNDFLQIFTNESIPTGIWTHFAVTYNGIGNTTGVKTYINGVEVSFSILRDTLTGSTLNTGSLKHGARYDGSFPFGGLMDDPRVYAVELSAADIANLAAGTNPDDTNLVGHWSYDGGVEGPGAQPSDGDPISRWDSRDEYDEFIFTQPVVAKRPIWISSSPNLNGLPGVQFDGVDDFLRALELLDGFVGQIFIPYYAVSVADLTANILLSTSHETSSSYRWSQFMHWTSGDPYPGTYTQEPSLNSVFFTNPTIAGNAYLDALYSDGDTWYFRRNGVVIAETPNIGSNVGAWFEDIAFKTSTLLGAVNPNGVEGAHANVLIPEVLIYNGVQFLDQDFITVEQYLMEKYGVF